MDDGDIYTVTVVGAGETTMEFDKNLKGLKDSLKISLESPLGIAIKGKKA
jgi:transcription elongation GreA/GreB family factor